jgi:CDP-diacylglycerol--glycerol-3-phosphate 3-phosphatidyltransferase
MNLPNGLTILRIFFVPLLVVVLLTREPNFNAFGLPFHFEMWGILIFLLAASTDFADGYLARKRREITTLGILLDPIADKLLISAVFISLVEMGLAPAWMVVIVIGRDFTVMGLRNIAASEGLTIPASALGKAKMALEVVTVSILILAAKHSAFRLLGTLLLWLVVISAVISAAHYFRVFWRQVDGRIKQRQTEVVVVKQEKKAQDVVARS